jgi:pilus assembly protein CpaD
MTRRFQMMFAGASLVALSGCAVSQSQIRDADLSRKQMVAAEVTAELKIDAIVSGEKLGDSERGAIRYFGDAYRHEGHGKVIISRPTMGADDVAALRAAADARAVLLAEGLDPATITEGSYDASGARSAPLVITYKTWEARVPGCPDISNYQIAWTGTNAALPSFGCAVNSNLAAQIANPGDLVGEHHLDPSDLRRRTIVISKYRNGEPTGASRSTDASGAISKAVGS